MENGKEGYVKSFDGISIRYISYGDEEEFPIILCDGLGCGGYEYKYLIPYLAKNYRVIYWDYRAHGKSGQPLNADSLTIENFAKDLDAVLNENNIKEAVIVGYSMGTQVILEYYKQFPSKVKGLILICGSYGRTLDTFLGFSLIGKLLFLTKPCVLKLSQNKLFKSLWKEVLKPSEFLYMISKIYFVNGYLLKKEDFKEPFFNHLSKIDPYLFMKMTYSMGEHSAEDILNKIIVPTLIIAGEEDSFTPIEVSKFIHKNIPNSEFMSLPRGRHTGPLEYYEQVNLRIEKFLNDHFRCYGK